MKKVVKEQDVFETVKTGTQKIDYWETSDGQLFSNLAGAETHEFYENKLKKRSPDLPFSVTVLNLNSPLDLHKYEDDYMYNVEVLNYNIEYLEFPATYVIHEYHKQSERDWHDVTTYADIYSLEDWKEIVIEGIKNFK